MYRYLIFLLLVLFSCNRMETPQGILTEEEMVQHLTEMYVLEGKIHRLSLSSDSGLEVFTRMNRRLAEKTGIPDSVFRRSLQYYALHPVELDRIYGALVDSLNLKEQRSSLQKE
jgi:hypothetical protein